MSTLHNLKPEKVIKAFERAGWINKGQRGSHVKLVKQGNPNILSIPIHREGVNMQNLNEDQIKRQDFVDNEIYDQKKGGRGNGGRER